ncbi:MAG TPA: GMC oxidoreductase, partial [Blastocatellia bacterium]|nr:GMC oxidoreductase [Blastocatellia bacterium]
VIVLCASTLESTRILLNSKSRQYPDGLGNSSGVLGRYLMDHTSQISAVGLVPVLRGMEYDHSDGRANGVYLPRFRNIHDKHPNFIRGYGIQAQALMSYGFYQARYRPGFGPEFKKLVRDTPREVSFWIGAYGEMLPRQENRVTIDPNKVDAWGIPVVHISSSHSDNELAMVKDALESIREMVDAAGYLTFSTSGTPAPPGFSIHEVGTARMGQDPKTSFLNQWNQSWDVKNLFVTDGSCFVSQGCQNPTLTMMAITARACDYLAGEYKRGNI